LFQETFIWGFIFFAPHIHTVQHLDIINIFYSPTDAQVLMSILM
jgi:hypothetical protein